MKIFISIIFILNITVAKSQTYPLFGSEIDVTINGLTFDTMEPFISNNGTYIFFNNLNDGINTKLYYATKINDSTFTFVGELNGTNQVTPPHLDAVADMDSLNNFYWTSTRNYPTELNNLFHGKFNSGNITEVGRVYGNFNKNIPGWLVMDHGISNNGEFLYYNNARFNDVCQGPCETEIGIAQKINDSTFNKTPNSNIILQNIIDSNYIYYAPCISSDNLELYYTRYPKDTITLSTVFEICVAVRNTPNETFSIPNVLFSEYILDLIEAPTLTTNKQVIYYHKKTSNSHKIVMRYRENTTDIKNFENSNLIFTIYPNPSKSILNIKTKSRYNNIIFSVFNMLGKRLITSSSTKIDISTINAGTYYLKIELDDKIEVKKFIKTE